MMGRVKPKSIVLLPVTVEQMKWVESLWGIAIGIPYHQMWAECEPDFALTSFEHEECCGDNKDCDLGFVNQSMMQWLVELLMTHINADQLLLYLPKEEQS